MSRRRIRLLRRLVGLTAVLLALLPSSALARPTCQLVSAKTMRAASGLSQVAAQSNDSSTECLVYAWAPSLHTSLPSRLPQTKFKAALKDGQIAIVRLLAEYAGPAGNRVTIELATLESDFHFGQFSAFSVPSFGAPLVQAGQERGASVVAGVWSWLNPTVEADTEPEPSVAIYLTHYATSPARLQAELIAIAKEVVPATKAGH